MSSKMSLPIRIALTGGLCVAVAAGLVVWIMGVDLGALWKSGPSSPDRLAAGDAGAVSGSSDSDRAKDEIFIDRAPFEDSGLSIAMQYMGPIHDPTSLRDLREAVQARGRVGLAVLKAEVDGLKLGSNPPREEVARAAQLSIRYGQILMYNGRMTEAAAAFARAQELGRSIQIDAEVLANLSALRGIASLRQGEADNCVMCLGPSSCILPIAPEAVHTQQAGSREAVKQFTEYLGEFPGDLRVRWLLNLAYMTLGEYPEQVPAEFRVPIDTGASTLDVGRFDNVTQPAGLTARGTGLAGGSIFDDFDGDGLPDILATSLDDDKGASLFINRGDGTFEDRSSSAGLDEQVYALNVTHADYDNDGDLDLLLLRGGWEKPLRPSLLRNRGDGTFEDVTVAAGMVDPISCESAAWGDYDNDGLVDVYLCGEYLPERPDPRNHGRLYRNQGDGTFRDVAAEAGVQNDNWSKGSAWGDYDDDGRLDLFVSNMIGPNRLYHNQGDGTFRDVAPDLGLDWDGRSFACWFWDFDNDGRLDLFVNDYSISLAEHVAILLGIPPGRSIRPRLYRNEGDGTFRDVTVDVRLDRAMGPMGCNFGDIDNDGFLDIYQGTGAMSYEHLVPNLLIKNVGGERFEDVTLSSGTGHLQKGHGVSFADYDRDGDLDLFSIPGGGVPGDKGHLLLFRNPGRGRHWLQVKLVGDRTNRAALGARIRAVVEGPDGSSREIHRTIGNNSSYGGNSLVETLGLGDATRVAELVVTWPVSQTTQTFRDLPANRAVVITEGTDSIADLFPPEPSEPAD